MATKNNRITTIAYSLITIIGIVLACTNLISNEYIKLLIVFGALGFGVYGLLKGLSTPSSEGNNTAQ